MYGAPIGCLGGLIGLGGAEFRLPALTRVFGYKAVEAVSINLSTVAAALAARLPAASGDGLLQLAPTIGVLAAASMAGGYVRTACLHHVHEALLERVIMALLILSAVNMFHSSPGASVQAPASLER